MSNVSTSMSPRDVIRLKAQSSNKRRELLSRFYFGLITVGLVLAVIPLTSIISDLIGKGLPFISWKFLTTNPVIPTFSDPNAVGGIANAISGSIIVVALAVAISVPLAVALAAALFEFKGKFFTAVGVVTEIFVGLPSIVFGIFAFITLVLTTKTFVAYYGSLALCFIMLPVTTVNCLAALRAVPPTLNEAGLALGSRPSRVMLRVILPTALPRIMTGIFLALSRTVGETAPVLFVVGSSLSVSWNINQRATVLPGLIWSNLQQGSPQQQVECWGIALVLIAFVFFFNILGRIFLARAEKK